MLLSNPTPYETPVVPCLIEAADDVKVVITYYQRMHDQECKTEGYEDYDRLQSCCSREGHDVHVGSEYIPMSEYAQRSAEAEQRLMDKVPDEAWPTASIEHRTRFGEVVYYRPASQA